jgi:hypothetical protein
MRFNINYTVFDLNSLATAYFYKGIKGDNINICLLPMAMNFKRMMNI